MKFNIEFIRDYNHSSAVYHFIVIFPRYIEVSTKDLSDILKDFNLLLRIHLHYRNLTFGFVAISKNKKFENEAKQIIRDFLIVLLNRANIGYKDIETNFNELELESLSHPSMIYQAFKIVKNAKSKAYLKEKNLLNDTKDILFEKFLDSLLQENEDSQSG